MVATIEGLDEGTGEGVSDDEHEIHLFPIDHRPDGIGVETTVVFGHDDGAASE